MTHTLATIPATAPVPAATTPGPAAESLAPLAVERPAPPPSPPAAPRTMRRRDVWWNISSMAAVHLACFLAIFTGVDPLALGICALLYVVRMFGVTAGYHRYFSHRTYKMGRVMQFLMAFLAQTSAQRGVLWWAAHHRHHHKHSDTEEDRHSPKDGFWWSHIGWINADEHIETDLDRIKDFSRFPELRWLDRYHHVPAIVLGTACFLVSGWSGLVVGFVWSTVLLWHGTFTINSLAHVIGTQTYPTNDTSRNHWFLALITLGEGWHNNHHHFQSSTAQGFRWWQLDITWCILWLMSWTGLVRDLTLPPRHVIENRPNPARARLAESAPAAPPTAVALNTPAAPAAASVVVAGMASATPIPAA
ncbi:MAG: acyl-CoA desaturase [Planctomycetota bacterium]